MILAVFPGQGSQTIGMARDVYEHFPVAKKTFEEADDVLGFSLSKLVFSASEEELRATSKAQPALFVACIAILKALECKYEREISDFADMLAGHSMGQYTALCAAGSIKFADALSLLKIRAKLMDTAPAGAMLASLGAPLEVLEQIVAKATTHGVCCVANHNSSTQKILSGETKAISFVESELGKLQYKTVMLKVSGAFHSPLMQNAAHSFQAFVNQVEFIDPKIPVINNITGTKLEAGTISKNLVDQIISPVKWLESIEYFLQFADSKNLQKSKTMPLMVEIGPNAVLTNLAKRDHKPMQFVNVANAQDIDSFITLLTSK
jgi:[acyl-carrier-protein] S-malonyltransferase